MGESMELVTKTDPFFPMKQELKTQKPLVYGWQLRLGVSPCSISSFSSSIDLDLRVLYDLGL